jgi:hypothetical protein
MNATLDGGAMFTLDNCNLVLPLQIEPELCAVAEIPAETNGRVGRNGAAPIQDVRNPAGGDAKIESQPTGGVSPRLKFAP